MYAKKVEYLKGLMAGLSLDPNTNEYKLFTAIIDAIDAFSGALSDVEEDVTDLEDTLDGLNDEMDSISDLMEALGDFDGDGDDNIRPFPGGEDGDEEDDDGGEYEVTCPGCTHVFIVDEETIFKGKASCPSCKEKLSFDIGGDGGCGCGRCHDGHKDEENDD
ncbi:MAG: hypothetical protein LBI19_09900 [Oscillospiraceae bacterium]|jgi:hypothetical protein|nr:hypothetical protein [Oscillospiraceae bacterium]